MLSTIVFTILMVLFTLSLAKGWVELAQIKSLLHEEGKTYGGSVRMTRFPLDLATPYGVLLTSGRTPERSFLLGHEIAHVRYNHLPFLMIVTPVYIGWFMLGWYFTDWTTYFQVGVVLFLLSSLVGKLTELHADYVGVKHSVKKGFVPDEAFFDQKSEEVEKYQSNWSIKLRKLFPSKGPLALALYLVGGKAHLPNDWRAKYIEHVAQH